MQHPATVRYPATAIITARRRATVIMARRRHGTKTTPNAAAPARASAPAAAWASARSAKALLRNSASADLIGNPTALGRVSARWRPRSGFVMFRRLVGCVFLLLLAEK